MSPSSTRMADSIVKELAQLLRSQASLYDANVVLDDTALLVRGKAFI